VTSSGKPGRPKRRTFTAAYAGQLRNHHDGTGGKSWR